MARISELKFDDKNFNKHTEYGMSLLEKSLRQNGAGRSILLDKDNNIIAGNGIIEAAGNIGLEDVQIVETDGTKIVAVKRTDIALDSEEGRTMALADNATASADLEWDAENIEEVSEKFDLDPGEWISDWSKDDKAEIEEDEAPEVNESEPAKSELGKVYQLGEHRLMCGDSTDAGSVAILMDGQKADMVFTDPPYGMKKEADGVLNDNQNFDDLLKFNKKWVPITLEAMKRNGSWYCWGIDEPLMDIYSHILKPLKKDVGEDKLTFRNIITWDKGVAQGQLAEEFRKYPVASEKCLFVMRGRQTYGDTSADYWDGFDPIRNALIKLVKSDLGLSTQEVCEYAGATTCSHWFSTSQWEFPATERFNYFCDAILKDGKVTREEYDKIREEYDKIREEWYKTRAYFNNTHDNMNDVWHFKPTSQDERKDTGGHATPKPLALCQRAIKTSTRDKEVVLDVFGGSGSTLIACEQLGRKCYMMELDPHYCDVIRKRYWKFAHDGDEEGWEKGTPAI